MEITQREFNRQFKKMPKGIQKSFILECGLKKRYENVLLLSYIEELDYISIGDRLGMQSESIGNMLVEARKQLRENSIKYYNEKMNTLFL